MIDIDIAWLALARDWKAGRLTRVHPKVAVTLNAALVKAHEDPVPFRATTDDDAPTLVELVRREHERAPSRSRRRSEPARRRKSPSDVQERARGG